MADDIFAGIDPEKLPDDARKLYKSMQADYTRKTQELAEQRKAFEAKEEKWLEQLKSQGALEQEVTQWRNWFATVEKQAKEPDGKDKGTPSDTGVDYTQENPEVAKLVTNLKTDIDTLKTQLGAFDVAIKEQGERTHRMFGLQSQLTELMSKYPGLDKEKLLKFATDNRIVDLGRAYNELYRDDIIKAEVDKRVVEELSKRRTDGITTTGGQHVLRTRGDSVPRTFGEATDQILRQKASDGTLG